MKPIRAFQIGIPFSEYLFWEDGIEFVFKYIESSPMHGSSHLMGEASMCFGETAWRGCVSHLTGCRMLVCSTLFGEI